MDTSHRGDDDRPIQSQISLEQGYTGQNAGGDFQQRKYVDRPKATMTPFTDDAADAKTSPKKLTLYEKLVGFLNNPRWNTIFVFACVLAVTSDPLFFYIPIINEPEKCVHMDGKLMKVALVLRSLMDVTFIVHIACQIPEAIAAMQSGLVIRRKSSVLAKFFGAHEHADADTVLAKFEWPSLLTDIFCILPIPQVLLVVVFFKMRGHRYLNFKKLLDFLLLVQYIARTYRIFLSANMLSETAGIWVKGLFNFFLYMLASHVFGGFYYFFSIQRKISCWHETCAAIGNCTSTFYCDSGHDDPHKKVLNEKCAPGSDFGFGIFKAALESHNTETKRFTEKLFYCFWWGLRNLSNFGTNLNETSNYPWENIFAIVLSIAGLLLFLYLIGNVQTYMQMQTSKSEEIRQKMISIRQDIEPWMNKEGLHDILRRAIFADIKQALGKNKDVSKEDIFSNLTWNTQKHLKRFICMPLISKVPKLRDMDERVRKKICDYLKPVKYPENRSIFQEDYPVDRIIFITEGTMYISSHHVLTRGDFYGDEQLLSWAAPGKDPSLEKLPTSTENVKSGSTVEGFTLSAADLAKTVRKCGRLWKYSNSA